MPSSCLAKVALLLLLAIGGSSPGQPEPPNLSAITLFACDEGGAVDERFRMNSGPIDAAWDVFLLAGEVPGDLSKIPWLSQETDHTLTVPLTEGRNVFTFLTEYEKDWSRTGMNLFFGGLNDSPAVSVMTPNALSPDDSSKFSLNHSAKTMGWPITEVPGAGSAVFNPDEIGLWGIPAADRSFRIELVDFQMRKPSGEAPLDLVGPHEVGPSGKPDWVGRIVLEVIATEPRPSDLFLWLQTQAGLTLGGPDKSEAWRTAFDPTSVPPPFSFDLGGKTFAEASLNWKLTREHRTLDEQRSSSTVAYTDPATGLEVRWEGTEYRDYRTVEWTVYVTNKGESDTPVISNLQGLDTALARRSGSEFVLHHNRGDTCAVDAFEPLTETLEPGETFHTAPTGGRPTNFAFPYFNLGAGDEGLVTAVGWPGQWAATLTREGARSLRLVAGQEETRFILHPSEVVRTPLIVLQFSEQGDWIDAQNQWRRWMIQYNLPRPDGKPLKLPGFAACSSHQFAEMTKANERNQIEFIDSYLAKGLNIDYWWMDAGWYVGAEEKNWPWTGTWEVDRRPHRFPNGLRAVSDHAHAKGVKIIVWFEPERVADGTWLATEHPDWILGKRGGLLNLGNPEAWNWLVGHIDKILSEEGIDLYRQDFNIDPLPHWRSNDTPDRVGMTENKYVMGYLGYWDELLRRHPGMLIDSCASGGRRNDLETLRRAVPLLRSDYLFEPVGQQCHTYGLSLWIPFYGTAYTPSNTVGWGWGTGGLSYDPYTRRSNMCPNNTACFDFRVPVQDELIQKLYREWLEVAPDFFGDYYPMTEYSQGTDTWIAWQFHQPEQGRGMVQAFRRPDNPYFGGQFRLRGLVPESRYEVVNFDSPHTETRSGQELMEKGLEIVLKDRPGAAVVAYREIVADNKAESADEAPGLDR